MSQRYTSQVAQERMADGLCPECGARPDAHSGDPRFWLRGGSCDLLPHGVADRIAQYRVDGEVASWSARR